MKIILNGKEKNLDKISSTVADLLTVFFKNEKSVIIEVNGKLVGKEQREELELTEGDRVEVIQFMGGG